MMYFPILSEELAKRPQNPRNHRVVIHWISYLGVFFWAAQTSKKTHDKTNDRTVGSLAMVFPTSIVGVLP